MNGFMTITIDDGETEEMIKVPSKFEVCPDCEGCGTDRGRSVECDGGGFTASEWAEACDDDPDYGDDEPGFARKYFSGFYDRTCECCKGKRVIEVIDRERADPKVIEAYDAQAQADAEYASVCAYERRMGC